MIKMSKSKSITQNEAVKVMLGVTTAMINNDKEGREAVYADLSAEDLKRVLRWTTRWFIGVFSTVSVMSGINPEDISDAWASIVMSTNQAIADGTLKEED